MGKVYYTLEEARAALPRVKPVLKQLIELHLKLTVQEHIDIGFEEPFEQYLQSLRQATHWHQTQVKLLQLLGKLAQIGVYVKSPERGLIDFYAMHEGREIFLCYQYPEESITHWHELESGFAGRQSVEMLERA
ncbi:DUF2203 domain-containing protein [Candidatus Woesearchaeota archaeon]|nr:DUF2203 domain-containing protein [Candidatus Woesearchaeota archaeon]